MKLSTALMMATPTPTTRAHTAPWNTKYPATASRTPASRWIQPQVVMLNEKTPFLADHVEGVVDQGDDPLDRLEHSYHDHHDAGEQDQTHGGAAGWPARGVLCGSVIGGHRMLLHDRVTSG